MLMLALLGLAPLAIGLHYLLHAPALLVFVVGGGAVAVLAEWMRRATEQIAIRSGSAIGGLLNVSFGSAAELVLMLFVVARGHPDVVRAQITGSIMGTTLLGLGLACLVGGVSREEQVFSQKRAGHLSSLLLIVVAALLLPAVFDHADLARAATVPERRMSEQALGVVASLILLALYAGNLVFTLVTHRDAFAGAGDDGKTASWSLPKAIGVLVGATVAVAACADIVSGALGNASTTLHLPPLFVGVVPLALIGTAADLFAAVGFARQDKMDLVMSISIGSAIQVGLVIAPLLLLVSWAMGQPMTLVFHSLLDLFAITGPAFIVNAVAADGKTTWFEGLLLVGVYLLLATAFFFVKV